MCNLNYDIIGKMETFTKDSKYILENTGILSLFLFNKKIELGDERLSPRHSSSKALIVLWDHPITFKCDRIIRQ